MAIGLSEAVVIHNHPRYLPMVRRILGASGLPSTTGALTHYDLNRLVDGPAKDACRLALEAPSWDSGGCAEGDLSSARLLFVGIDPGSELPPMWQTILWAWIQERPGSGALVLLECPESETGPDDLEFFRNLARAARLDFVRQRGVGEMSGRVPPN